jgi:hypothetical protein
MQNILIILATIICISGCSTNSNSQHLNDRYPTNNENCTEITRQIINSSNDPKVDPNFLAEHKILWDNYYQKKASPQYRDVWNSFSGYYKNNFWELKQKGSLEIEIFEQLGFEVTSEKIVNPDLETFIKKYSNYLDMKKIPENQRILPAISVRRKSDNKILLHNPLVPWSKNLDEWKPALGIKLNGRDIAENLAEGRFPLFTEGYHDVFHFIIFAMIPEHAKIIREKNRELIKLKLNKSILNRSAYALEVLTLADSTKLLEISGHLTIKNVVDTMNFDDFLSAVSNLSPEELSLKSQFWLVHFQKYLTHYSAGMAEPVEKEIYDIRLYNHMPWSEYILDHFYDGVRTVKEENSNKILPNDILVEGMSHMDTVLKIIVNSSERSIEEIFTYPKLDNVMTKDQLLKMQVARMEYALWKSATTVTSKQWTDDTMKEKVDLLSPTMMFIKDCFGKNSLTYHLFQ